MNARFAISGVLGFCLAISAFGQRPEERREGPRANHGRIPEGPPPRREVHAKPEVERHDTRVNSTPHVSNDHWYGHDRPNDRRYVIAHPFEHGRFEHIGASYRYRIEHFDRDHHRFWFPGGFGFEIASWDWSLAEDWCWDCSADDFTIYDDPDHVGWYLMYNIHTGAYIHVQYIGT